LKNENYNNDRLVYKKENGSINWTLPKRIKRGFMILLF